MDVALFNSLNRLAGHGALWDGLLVFCANDLAYVLVAVLLVASWWPRRRWQMAITALFAGAIARGLVKTLIVFLWPRPRPYVSLDLAHQLVAKIGGEDLASFPSGHALFFFALASVVYAYDPKLGRWFFAGATLMALARVIAGLHWPSDVVVGAALGSLTAWAILKLIPPPHPTHG